MLDINIAYGMVVAGILLMVGELLIPGRNYLSVPGWFFAALGTTAVFNRDEAFIFSYGLVAAGVVALVDAVAHKLYYDGLDKKLGVSRKGPSSRLIGRKGKVVKVIDKDRPGKVRIEGVDWVARSDSEVEVGTRVEVVDMKGVQLVVVEADRPVRDGEDGEE